ncbi:MAG: TadE family protein [Verrucomicrobiota bacterium]
MNIIKLIQKRFLGKSVSTRRGQSMVEFAIVAPLFFLMVFGIIDIGRVIFSQITLQNAMRQAGRFAVTGNRLTDPVTLQPMSRVNSIIETAKKAAVGLDVTNIQISSAAGGNSGAARAGGPRDVVTISMTSNLKLITPMIGRFFGASGIYTFTVKTTFLNEPFASTQTS